MRGNSKQLRPSPDEVVNRTSGNTPLVRHRVISNDVDHFKRFSSYFCAHEHTFSHGTRIAFRWLRCFTCVTLTSSGRFRCIDPVLPTKHLFGHDRP